MYHCNTCNKNNAVSGTSELSPSKIDVPMLPFQYWYDEKEDTHHIECCKCGFIFPEKNHAPMKKCPSCKFPFHPYKWHNNNIIPCKKNNSKNYKDKGYVMIDLEGKEYPRHKVVLRFLDTDVPKHATIHHMNHNKQDDRPCNLYICDWETHRRFHNGTIPEPMESNIYEYRRVV